MTHRTAQIVIWTALVILLLIGLLAPVPNSLPTPMAASGWLAGGLFSTGVLFAGLFSLGIFSAGLFSVGIFSVGVFSLGIFSFGTFAVGIWAAGQFVQRLKEMRE